MCFARDARDRRSAAELLEHPFLALPQEWDAKAKARWVSPKSTLDAAFWESESDEEGEEDEVLGNAAERIKSLASCSVSGLPDWDSDEGWIDVLGEQCDEAFDCPASKEPDGVASGAARKAIGSAAVPAEDVPVVGCLSSDEQLDAECVPFGGEILADDRQNKAFSSSDRDVLLSFEILPCNRIVAIENFRFARISQSRSSNLSFVTALFCSRSVKCAHTEFLCLFGENSTVLLHFCSIAKEVLLSTP
jgi:hypothetical protein